tara:strand:+ start:110 stop:289 length:180 start_codon:yes stop_codon:yes gene_type:complete
MVKALSLKDVEKAIESLENKIKKQGNIVNDRDSNHLDNLQQLYISLIMKEGRKNNNKGD